VFGQASTAALRAAKIWSQLLKAVAPPDPVPGLGVVPFDRIARGRPEVLEVGDQQVALQRPQLSMQEDVLD
jgi:hypothetical protein